MEADFCSGPFFPKQAVEPLSARLGEEGVMGRTCVRANGLWPLAVQAVLIKKNNQPIEAVGRRIFLAAQIIVCRKGDAGEQCKKERRKNKKKRNAGCSDAHKARNMIQPVIVKPVFARAAIPRIEKGRDDEQ